MIRFACPGCNATFSVSDDQAGQPGACDKCGVRFLIPASLTAPVEAPAAPPAVDEPPPLPSPERPNNTPEVRHCPTCEAKVSILTEDIGHEVECPACRAIFKVKASSTPRSGSHRRRDDDDDEYQPRSRRSSRRRSKRDDEEDDEDPDTKYRKRSRSRYDDEDDKDYERDEFGYAAKPNEVQTISTLLIVGGVIACLAAVGMALTSGGFCCFWPGTYYELVYGILAIIRGSQLSQDRAFDHPPNGVCIMGIITIVNGDLLNMTLGIIGLSLANSATVRRYFRA